jgi:hypothetical protein
MKNAVFWDARRVVLVRTNVSKNVSPVIKVKRIGELGTLAVTGN